MKKQPRAWFKIEVQALANGAPPEVADVNIYDEIGPSFCGEPAVNATSFVKALDELPPSIKTVRVHVNSPGGDVFDATTIANRLSAQRAEKGRTVEVLIEGIAASAATIITAAGNPVKISDNALVMIHNPTVGGRGDAAAMRRMASTLDTVKASIIATYQRLSSKTSEELSAMMDAETWMDAGQAVANGFATEVVSGVQVSNTLREAAVARLGQIPEALRPRVEALVASQEEPAPVAPPAPPAPRALTREAVAAEAPQLVEALLAEGKAAGAQAERARLAELDEVALPGHEALVAQARTEGWDAGRLAVAQSKAEKAARAGYLDRARADAAPLAAVPPAPLVMPSSKSEQEERKLVSSGIAAGGNKRRSRR